MKLNLEEAFLDDLEDEKLGDEASFSDKARILLAQQKQVWELMRTNYDALKNVQQRSFEFDGFQVKVQYNPARMTSSAAKVDTKSISERPCFLCYKNLPEVQKGLRYTADYLVLCNPFPIFPEHLTIPSVNHSPQLILPSFEAMLDLSESLEAFTIFYNGPKCGASAPDHTHYQAGNKGFMPIEAEYESISKQYGETIFKSETLKVVAVDQYLRKFIALESDSKPDLILAFRIIYDILQKMNVENGEPKMNILAGKYDATWRIIIFPRGEHRPWQFFETGEKNILISPASVDFGGVFITPQEKDFLKITKADIIDIFKQTSISERNFELLQNGIRERFD